MDKSIPMKKIQFFTGTGIQKLQSKKHDWLANNRDIDITATNLNTEYIPGVAATGTENHVFYILYTIAAMEAKGVAEMLETGTITVQNITQDILQGTIEKPQLSNRLDLNRGAK
jgi:hypothetical protein